QYLGATDQQTFIAVGTVQIEDGPAIRGTYGDLRAVRARTGSDSLSTFIYPRSLTDPSIDAVRQSLGVTRDGFRSAAGRVSGSLYTGLHSAGGFGASLEL